MPLVWQAAIKKASDESQAIGGVDDGEDQNRPPGSGAMLSRHLATRVDRDRAVGDGRACGRHMTEATSPTTVPATTSDGIAWCTLR